MTADDRFDRTLPAWLRDDAAHRVTDHLDEVLRVTATTRQRPAWSSLERWLPVDTTLRPRLFNLPPAGRLVLVAAVILALVGLLIFAVGSRQQRLPPPFGLARNGALVSSGDGDIYSIDPATGAKKILVGGDQFDFGGTFARDGTKFMFLRGATGCGTSDCGLQLMVADADGTGVRQLTPGLQALDWQDWSPDGTQIVINSADPSGVGHVMSVVDVASGTMRTLDVGRSVHEMSWLPPDGAEIVFRGEQSSPRDPLPGIFAVRPDGSGLRSLTTRPAVDSNDYQDVGVSPDGQYVTYQDTNFAENPPWGLFQVHILSLRTGEDRVLPKPAGAAQMGGSFSPDGTLIAFVRVTSDGQAQMAVAPTDGSGPGVGIGPIVRYAAGTDNINNYSWSPDGTAVLANYDADKTGRLLPIDGSAPTTLVHGEMALPGYQRLAP
jgi:Tol biopolymer transport system component